MAKKRRLDPDVQAFIERFAIEGYSGASIERQLRQEKVFRSRMPSLRTIQSIAREAAPTDPAAWWSAADADPDEARALLKVLGELLRQTEGRGRITREHASWIANVLLWAPDLPPAEAYALGWAYAHADRAGESRDSLDRYLALELWRDAEQHVKAFRDGWLDVLVWQPEMKKFGSPLDLERERPGATILWPFMDPRVPVVALSSPRRGSHKATGIRLGRTAAKGGGTR